MGLIKTILAFALTILVLLIYLPIAIPAYLLGFLGLREPMSWVIYKLAQLWANTIILITGCTMDIKGREHIPAGGSVCFVSNHVGIFDIILSLAHIGQPFGFIAKKELSYIPFFNLWIPLLGGLYIDRKSLRKALKTINKGIEKIKDGSSMLIFPEGTRSKGSGLLPFHSGSVKLATQSLAPIVPIAITGSYEVFEKNYRVQAVQVRMVFCPPIMTAEMSSDERKHNLAGQIRSVIETALANP